MFRHYADYLYTRDEISHQTLHWIQARVPGRRTPKTPRNPAVDLEELCSTLAYLAENHERYHLLYRLMLESDLRFEHVLRLLASPIIEGSVVVYNRVYSRLYCDEERGFCRLYLGFNQGVKRTEFAYFSIKTRRLTESLTP